MKFKITAGGEIDVLTQDEMRQVLASWATEITRGVKFRQFSGSAVVTGAVWTIGGNASDNNKDPLGPREGLVWGVTRISVSGGGYLAGTDLYSAYIDEVAPSKLIQSRINGNTQWDKGIVTLVGGARLALAGAGTGAGADVTVSGQAIELPAALAWQLL